MVTLSTIQQFTITLQNHLEYIMASVSKKITTSYQQWFQPKSQTYIPKICTKYSQNLYY